jgi:hypothetical protein
VAPGRSPRCVGSLSLRLDVIEGAGSEAQAAGAAGEASAGPVDPVAEAAARVAAGHPAASPAGVPRHPLPPSGELERRFLEVVVGSFLPRLSHPQ